MDLLARVAERIDAENLSEAAAARQIGVGVGSLRRHLAGEYARSDSLAKYRLWLDPSAEPPTAQAVTSVSSVTKPAARYGPESLGRPMPPEGGWRVVDLFAGCGGLSLGFELAESSDFRLVLAADNNERALDILARNRMTDWNPVRLIDLASFESEAEILAFYLDHLSTSPGQADLAQALHAAPICLDVFKRRIQEIDDRFVRRMSELRATPEWRATLRGVDPVVLRQTSVLGFHDSLALPRPAARECDLRALPWSSPASPSAERVMTPARRFSSDAERVWDEAADALRKKAKATGARGQLASSARRITQFAALLDTEPLKEQRSIWVEWRAARSQVRAAGFSRDASDALSELYASNRVSVLLGGPPCQGFSRIGRGKIRSLRENGVHVHEDAEAGDSRNRLIEAYTRWVGALSPDVFLFENVRHFQATVKTPEGEFAASDLLAEAIESLSESHLQYSVSSRVVDASEHCVPQTRERFFMVGVRGSATDLSGLDPARWILDLPRDEQVPLSVALDGLGATVTGDGAIARKVPSAAPSSVNGAEGTYSAWVSAMPSRRTPTLAGHADGHVARAPREDDAAWFSLMAPGTRWMDYRSDGAATVSRLTAALQEAAGVAKVSGASDLAVELEALLERVDGSLSIRLLLEAIEPAAGEEQHHLLTETYLRKREGNHGDWIARLAPDRPAKTIVSHMAKDTYAYVHPWEGRTLSVREAARIQTFPDWFEFGGSSLGDAFRAVGNAVPPLLAAQLGERVGQVLTVRAASRADAADRDRALTG